MILEGQGRSRPLMKSRQRGYAMAALLVGLSVMSVLMGAMLPVWSHMAQREKEAELIFRGQQYARAIGLFQRKFANTAPPSIDVLVDQRFLRKKYKDPITNDDFQPLYANQAPARRGLSDWIAPPGRDRDHRTRRRRANPCISGQTWIWSPWGDYRRDLEEQRDVHQDLQRPNQVQRVGVRLRSDGAATRRAGHGGDGYTAAGSTRSGAGCVADGGPWNAPARNAARTRFEPGASTARQLSWHDARAECAFWGTAKAGAIGARYSLPNDRTTDLVTVWRLVIA